MRAFRDYSIKGKLTLVMVLTSALALVLVCLSVVAFEYSRSKKNIVRDLTTEAEIIGVNSAAALMFSDGRAAQETLRVLRGRPVIVSAQLFKPDGRLFVEFVRPGGVAGKAMPSAGPHFEKGRAIYCHAIRLENDLVGYVCLHADLAVFQAGFRSFALIMCGVLAASLIITFLAANRLQRLISDPLMALTRAARAVSEGKDYSLRASKQTNDEVGYLTHEFNEMLDRINRRDMALHASEERFRQITDNIREVFWMTNLGMTEIIYVSKGYEQVWGRSGERLYTNPMDWADAIHPEDRARVEAAAAQTAMGGAFNEEYRIVRPDGTVRWIRDRAFPVQNQQGQTYRLAGIAEDVTERRRMESEILEISEREQTRIGQDLHDGLCQHLMRTSIAGNLLWRDLAEKNLPDAATAERISGLLHDALTQARTVARGLYPVKLDDEGLASAIAEMAASVGRDSPVRFILDNEDSVRVADHQVAIHLYRIAQEATSNALRHATPGKIVIALRDDGVAIHMHISDDGVGIPEPARPGKGMGLSIMAYRAHMIGGTLTVERRHNGGTVVSCSVPHKPAPMI